MNTLSLSNRSLIQRPAVAPLSDVIGLGGALAGIAGGLAMTSVAALMAGSYGYNIWFQLKAIASLVLGPSAIAPAGFAAGSVLVGLLIHLAVAGLLGALFAIITRQIFRLPSDFGVPAVTGLTYGLLIWLATYLVVSALSPQLTAVAGPAFIIVYIVYGVVTGLALAALRPQPYAAMN